MKAFLITLVTAGLLAATPAHATTFRIAISGVWTLVADGDTDAVGDFIAIVQGNFTDPSFTDVSAVQSPVQSVPGATTFDVTAEFVVSVDATSLTDSLTKLTLKSVGQAVLKAAKITGTTQ